MKQLIAALIISLFFTPALVAADSLYGVEPTLGQLLSRVAALGAILENKSLTCAVAATKNVVKIGEQFTLAWGSFGAEQRYSTDTQNAYSNNGQQVLALDTVGTRTYHLSFFGPHGTKVTCDQAVTVTK